MAQLVVRKVEDVVVKRLRRRAARHGVSMEEEHRRILRNELIGGRTSARASFKEYLETMPDAGEDDDFARPPSRARRVRL